MTPSITGIPTDNLYKFMAIGGLVLMFFSYFISISQFSDIEQKVNILEAQSTHVKNLREDLESLTSTETRVENLSTESVNRILDRHEMAFQDYQRQFNKLSQQFATLPVEQTERNLSAALIGFKLGSVLALLGFILWYWKVQRHLDEMIRLNRKKLEIENGSLAKELLGRKND